MKRSMKLLIPKQKIKKYCKIKIIEKYFLKPNASNIEIGLSISTPAEVVRRVVKEYLTEKTITVKSKL
jgi:hypothetical protein